MTMSNSTTDSQFPTSGRWQPSADDHLIYRWIKFEGYTQSQVAQMLRISQPTVSRVIQRYERWQAHLKDREGGRLDAEERLRAQRWLTYERNELILASCFRIADEMERSTELSKTTIRRPIDELQPRELKTEQRVVDRHGVASRFLRLAFRVNIEQLKLADLIAREAGPSAEPLTDEELAAELRQAAANAAELAAGRQQAHEEIADDTSESTGSGVFGGEDLSTTSDGCPPKTPDPLPPDHAEPPACPTHHSPTHHSPTVNTVNNLNNDPVLQINITPTTSCTCMLHGGSEKNSPCTCISNAPAIPGCDTKRPHEHAPQTQHSSPPAVAAS